MKRTDFSELGEFGFINKLEKSITIKNKNIIKGIGDDAAVVDFKDNKAVISTDMLCEGVHFEMSYTPLIHLGYKAVVVNVSDIIAMNAKPLAITVSISISNRYSVEAIEELYSGIKLACEKYNIDLIGGDTSSSISGMTISVTIFGEAEEEKIVYRNGAKKGDLIVATGDLGSAYLGYQILEREKSIFMENSEVQPDLSGYDYQLERFLKPEARIDALHIFEKENIIPTSMIDISDGLASEIIHLCMKSKKGCELYEDKIPIDVESILKIQEFDINPTTIALNGGEDYELLFTVSQSDYDKILNQSIFSIIGYITDDEGKYNLNLRTDEVVELKSLGWDAFMNKNDK